jgi:hypothetical protein
VASISVAPTAVFKEAPEPTSKIPQRSFGIIECGFGVDRKDLGGGRLEVTGVESSVTRTIYLTFRNSIGSILFRGNILKATRIVPIKQDLLFEAEDSIELDFLAFETSKSGVEKRQCRCSVTETELEKMRDFVTQAK